MRAAQIVAPRRIELVDAPMPRMERGKVLVRATSLGICGSDRPALFHAQPEAAYPLPVGHPGHEFLGVVEESDHEEFRTGDRVLALPDSGALFQEYLVVDPHDYLLKLPAGAGLRTLAAVQPLGTVFHAARMWGNLLGKDAVVLGQGPIGLMFTALLRLAGARRVIAVDPVGYRLNVARLMGATDLVPAGEADVIEAVRDLTGGRLADLAVEACGLEETYNLVFEVIKRRGAVTLFGVPKKNPMTILVTGMFRKEATVQNAVMGYRDVAAKHANMPLALDYLMAGRIDVAPLLTHLLPFEQIQTAFEMAEHKTDGVIKITLSLEGGG